eukprot:scaffold9067_cov169-Ochromonas_danica.AAC.2
MSELISYLNANCKSAWSGRVWLDIEGTAYWYSSTTTNQEWYKSLVDSCSTYGVACGVYSSYYQWSSLFGSTYFSYGMLIMTTTLHSLTSRASAVGPALMLNSITATLPSAAWVWIRTMLLMASNHYKPFNIFTNVPPGNHIYLPIEYQVGAAVVISLMRWIFTSYWNLHHPNTELPNLQQELQAIKIIFA